MVKKIYIVAALAVGFMSCQSAQPPKPVEIGNGAGASNGMVGLLEVRIDGIGEGATPTASANFINLERFGKDTQTRAISSFPLYVDTNLAFQRQSVAFVDTNDFASTTDINTTGASRYLTATFNITNNTATSFNNLTLVAASVPPTPGVPGATTGSIGGTGFNLIQLGNGTVLSNSNPTDVAIAQKIVPATGVGISATGVTPVSGMTDFQIITSSEASVVKTQAAAFVPPLDVDPLQYALVARNLAGGRAIPNGGGTGRITLSYKLPKISPRTANPFSFSIYYVVTNDTSQFISQAPEEQGELLLNSSFDTLTTDVRVLEGSRLVSRDDLLPTCGIQTAFVRATSTSTFYNPAKGINNLGFGSTTNQPDCLFGASGRRATTFGANEATAGITNIGSTVYLVGTTGTAPNRDIAIWSVLSDGTANTSFNTDGRMTIDFGGDDVAASIAFDTSGATGDLFVAGTNGTAPARNFAVARVNTNGTLDTAFDTDGKQTYNINNDDVAADLVVQSTNGRVVVVGSNFVGASANFAVIRITNIGVLDASFGGGDGTLDFTFGSEDIGTSVVLDSNEKIIIGGYTNVNSATTGPNDFAVARVTTAGALDTLFSGDGINTADFGNDDRIWDVAVYPSSNATNAGRVVAVGQWDGGSSDFAAVRFEVDGTLDTTFGSGFFGSGTGKFNTTFGNGGFGGSEYARAVNLDSTGRIYLTGYTNNINGATPAGGEDIGILRLTPLGVLDTTFDTDGKLTVDINGTDDQGIATVIDASADLMIGSTIVGISGDFAITRIEE